MNSPAAASQGYLSAQYAPFKVTPGTAGLANTTNPDGQRAFDTRWNLLHELDDPMRVNSPFGKPMEDYNNFYSSAKGLMYNPVVNKAFQITAADRARYGTTGFGDSCLVAKQVLEANQGTRFIQITQGGWDMHTEHLRWQPAPQYGQAAG